MAVWWTAICGERTIYDAFWREDLIVNTSNPDLTNCFQNTLMQWIPWLLFLIVSLLYVLFVQVAEENKRNVYTSNSSRIRIILTFILVFISMVDLAACFVYAFSDQSNYVKPVNYLSTVSKMLAYILLLILEKWSWVQGIHSPSIVFFFWLIELILSLVTVRSKITQHLQKYPVEMESLVTQILYFVFTLAALITCFFPGRKSSVKTSKNHKPRSANPKTCRKLNASFPSILFFGWFSGKIYTGYKKLLTMQDIWDIRAEDSCQTIVPAFEKEWSRELENQHQTDRNESSAVQNQHTVKPKLKTSLAFALARTFGHTLLMSGTLLIGYYLMSLVNPQLLQLLIAFVEEQNPYVWWGYLYAVLMFLSSVVSVIFLHHAMNLNYTIGMRVRTALTSAIYKKALTLSPRATKNSTVGEIVNLMSVDTQKLQDAPMFFNYIWGSPVIVALAMYFLWQILGPACLTGLAFMFLLLPVNSIFMAKKIREFQKCQMSLKDRRIKLMTQVLGGIKVLKLYAWEPYFNKELLDIRDSELVNLRKSALLGAVTYIAWFCSPFLVALLCFTTFVMSDSNNVLDAQTAFVSMSLINLMNFPLTILPVSIMFLVQAVVSLKRVSKFLQCEELDPQNVHHDLDDDYVIRISNGQFSWGEEDRPTLSDLNLKVKPGKLVAVVGQVGCGKSSLLSSLLGEMIKLDGYVNVMGSLSYIPQQSWIQNMTVKDNILFSKPMNQRRYEEVIEASALRPDLKILPGGDMTEIGERGINLSGGQKARIALARAVYQDTDIYLFDDPLSAVDSHVGKHIFDKIIGHDGMLQHKTRVLVTNQLQYLSGVDEIIVMQDGKISEIGTYTGLLEKQGTFAELVKTYVKDNNSDNEDSRDSLRIGSSNKSQRRKRQCSYIQKSMSDKVQMVDKTSVAKKDVLIKEETMEVGNVSFSVVKAYVQAASGGYVVFMLLSLLLFIASQVGTNIWLSEWSADKPVNGTMDGNLLRLRLGVYGALGAGQTVGVLGLATAIALGSVAASRKLHYELLNNVMRCPMSFFDTTPLGRIVNRFSKDIDTVDVNIPQFSQNLMTTLAPLISTFIMIIYSTPIFVAVFIPLAIIFVILQRVYVKCARQLKRIDAVKRSPIYGNFSESLQGRSSIRAFGHQQRFITHLENLLDDSQRVWFEVFSSNRWVGVYSEMLGDIVVLFTALFAVMQRDTIDPGLVGLSLSFALQVSLNLVMTMRSSCELETYIVGVERIKEYSDLENEALWYVQQHMPSVTWPDCGKVSFNNYSTKYRTGLELVLRGITCTIKPGEKVGIVGRTGAGKSSLTLALFRILEPSGGSIEIDGEDITQMGLHVVRSRLTIIPQDPVLFSGSLRFNLDPSKVYADDDVWVALEHAHLKEFVCSLPGVLEYECGENGQNLSVGQRQLVCLARALLRKSRILVLDEATASVDLETDDLIQSTIRSEFKDSTVITIAHRLHTITDYDRVVVMSEGSICEFDKPEKLMQSKKTIFYGMAKDAGLI